MKRFFVFEILPVQLKSPSTALWPNFGHWGGRFGTQKLAKNMTIFKKCLILSKFVECCKQTLLDDFSPLLSMNRMIWYMSVYCVQSPSRQSTQFFLDDIFGDTPLPGYDDVIHVQVPRMLLSGQVDPLMDHKRPCMTKKFIRNFQDSCKNHCAFLRSWKNTLVLTRFWIWANMNVLRFSCQVPSCYLLMTELMLIVSMINKPYYDRNLLSMVIIYF